VFMKRTWSVHEPVLFMLVWVGCMPLRLSKKVIHTRMVETLYRPKDVSKHWNTSMALPLVPLDVKPNAINRSI
jgi:hypothetical protein